MSVHPIDFQINQDVFSTPESKRIFDERAVIQRWLDFEAALAVVQGEEGLIPREAAKEIREKAKVDGLDLEMIRAGYEKSRNSLIPVLKALRAACSKDAGQYVHYGPTTQDVLDTAQIVGIRKALSIIYRDLREIEGRCLELAASHRSTPMVGRSHGQQALPITFGLKVAVWLKENRFNINRIKYLWSSMRYGQFGGAVGTLASLGGRGEVIAEKTLNMLGLDYDPLAWHTRRDAITELASMLSISTATLAKIANEIYQLQKTEIGELAEPPPKGQPASSTMPHKQNPVICQRVVAIFRHVSSLAPVVLQGMCQEHERDPRCLWSEWLAIPQICIYSATAANYMKAVLSGLKVSREHMIRNLRSQGDLIAAEWLLFKLANKIGKMNALDKLHALISTARATNKRLKDIILADEETGMFFEEKDLEILDQPERYTGNAQRIVDKVILDVEDARKLDPGSLS